MVTLVNRNRSRLTEIQTTYPIIRKLNILAKPKPLSGKPLNINKLSGNVITHPTTITNSQANTGNRLFQLFLLNSWDQVPPWRCINQSDSVSSRCRVPGSTSLSPNSEITRLPEGTSGSNMSLNSASDFLPSFLNTSTGGWSYPITLSSA